MRWRRSRAVPMARPPRSLRRQQLELLALYLGCLSSVLLVFAVLVREGFRSIATAEVRSQLVLIADDFAALPLPVSDREGSRHGVSRDVAAAHQQVEWFAGSAPAPFARLGQVRALGPLPPGGPGQRLLWQDSGNALAVVLPVDAAGLDASGRPRVWLRVSQGLEPLQARMHQLDLALAGAISLALVLSAVTARGLAQRVVEPLERSLRRLRTFGLDASHELRGPLAALAANAEMGLLDCPAGDEAQRRRFAAIASAADQMQRLVEDLLQLARQDQGPLESLQRLDPAELLDAQLALYRDALVQRRQGLDCDLQRGLTVLGQAKLLNQLVRNLLDNAYRHCPPGAQIQVRLRRQGHQACLEISDDGPGLEPEQLPRVFDRFWRASADRSDGGNGMGLAIAARITEAHGGDIRVSSSPGRGCCFQVLLPLAPAL